MTQQPVLEIYTEFTPNPESLKFVTNRMLLPQLSIDCKNVQESEEVPLAKEVFTFPYVNGVFIANNFITVSKKPGYAWDEIIPEVKDFLKEFIKEGKTVVTQNYKPAQSENPVAAPTGKEGELETRIRELLDVYVKPAVENDGGAIQFKSFHEGIVTLILQGSCSGCPSSTVTLKSGIEGLLKRMVPEVKEVVAEAA
ncbi:MAG: NifU family protein [Chitinophagales bacterium]|nr:NifU family protein [Chitinophagales bacterium]